MPGGPAPGPAGGPYGPPPGGPAPGVGGSYGPPPGGPMVPAGGPMMAGAHGPVGQVRNPVMSLVIGLVCGFYLLYLLWVEANELKAFRGKDDINPILFFVPILNIILIWGLPAKVLEAKQMAGIPNANVSSPILYLFLWPYFLTGDLNEIWQAAGGGGQVPGLPGVPGM